jgi:hypothetical protein
MFSPAQSTVNNQAAESSTPTMSLCRCSVRLTTDYQRPPARELTYQLLPRAVEHLKKLAVTGSS